MNLTIHGRKVEIVHSSLMWPDQPEDHWHTNNVKLFTRVDHVQWLRVYDFRSAVETMELFQMATNSNEVDLVFEMLREQQK